MTRPQDTNIEDMMGSKPLASQQDGKASSQSGPTGPCTAAKGKALVTPANDYNSHPLFPCSYGEPLQATKWNHQTRNHRLQSSFGVGHCTGSSLGLCEPGGRDGATGAQDQLAIRDPVRIGIAVLKRCSQRAQRGSMKPNQIRMQVRVHLEHSKLCASGAK